MDIDQFCQWETHQSRWCRRGRVMKLLVGCMQWTWSFKNHLYFKWVASLSWISCIYLLRNVTFRDSKIGLKFFVIEFFFFGFTTCAICDEIFLKFLSLCMFEEYKRLVWKITFVFIWLIVVFILILTVLFEFMWQWQCWSIRTFSDYLTFIVMIDPKDRSIQYVQLLTLFWNIFCYSFFRIIIQIVTPHAEIYFHGISNGTMVQGNMHWTYDPKVDC